MEAVFSDLDVCGTFSVEHFIFVHSYDADHAEVVPPYVS